MHKYIQLCKPAFSVCFDVNCQNELRLYCTYHTYIHHQEKSLWNVLLVLFNVCPHLRTCVFGIHWTFLLCSSIYVSSCTLFTLLPASSVGSTALGWQQRSGAASPGRPEEDKLAEAILRPGGDTLQSPASHYILSGKGTAWVTQRHADIW